MEKFTTPSGLVLMVHDKTSCAGKFCTIHNPSPQSEALGRLWFRSDRIIFERICEHGVGHYDMDQWAYHLKVDEEWQNIHACCGCCVIYDENYMKEAGYDDRD